MHGAAISGKYTLHGNVLADYGMVSFDNYELYLTRWNEWKNNGWTNESEPLPASGTRQPRTFQPSKEVVRQVLDDTFGEPRSGK